MPARSIVLLLLRFSVLISTISAFPVSDSIFESTFVPLTNNPQAPLLESLPPTGGKTYKVINSQQLQDLITVEQLQEEAENLYNISHLSTSEYGFPTRIIGSPGHWGTVSHILRTLGEYAYYYDISVQRFSTVLSDVTDIQLLFNGISPGAYDALSLSPPTDGFLNGTLVKIDNFGCDIADYPSVEESSKNLIAFIERGNCSFGHKSIAAGQANFKAAIIYNNEYSNDTLKGTLGEPTGKEIPTASITKSSAEYYLEHYLNKKLSVDVSLLIDSYVKNVSTVNIIAESIMGDENNIIMAGGHTDSVDSPGINDDGSGTISLLVLAKHLAKFEPVNKIKLGFWSAEEEGLIGSTHYVSQLSPEEIQKHRLFLDYDMMASKNYAYQIYDGNNIDNPAGSEEIKQLYIDWYTEQGLNYSLIEFDGRSDYAAFIENNIAGGGIATGAEGIKTNEEQELFGGEAGKWYDECYHQHCDDINNVDYEAWLVNSKLIAHSIGTYGLSLDGFPEKKNAASISSTDEFKFKYRGDYLII